MLIIDKAYRWNGQLELRNRTELLILHHAAARECSVDDVHRWHLENGWVGIGYNFFVRKNGSVYRGRPESAVGAHTEGYNSQSIGICFEGNYNVEQEMPEAQKRAGKELVAYLRGKYPGIRVARHRDFDDTACPGRYLPYGELISGLGSTVVVGGKTKGEIEVKVPQLQKGDNSGYVRTVQILLNKYNDAALAEDGDFGAGTDRAVRAYQKSRGLTVDGIVGSSTWGQLLK